MAADDDNVARAYARLVGLKESLPDGTSIPERYVEEYHQALSLEGRDKRPYASGTTELPGYTEFLQEASVPRAQQALSRRHAVAIRRAMPAGSRLSRPNPTEAV